MIALSLPYPFEVGFMQRALEAGLIVGVPFILILKQPDLGSALVLYPITLVMFYFGNVRPSVTMTNLKMSPCSPEAKQW